MKRLVWAINAGVRLSTEMNRDKFVIIGRSWFLLLHHADRPHSALPNCVCDFAVSLTKIVVAVVAEEKD